MIRFSLAKNIRKAWMDADSDSDPDLKALLDSGWSIKRTDIIMSDSELAVFLDANGPISINDIYVHFEKDYKPGAVDVAVANLFAGGYIQSMRALNSISGVYVSKKHVERHREAIGNLTRGAEPVPFLVEEDIVVVDTTAVVPKAIEDIQLTKADGKRQRAIIIDMAKPEHILGSSFRTSFWDNMPKEAVSYWNALDQFRQKLIITEIKKKA